MRHIFIISFLLIHFSTIAQIEKRPGYIVTLRTDTIEGYIDYRNKKLNLTSCTFILNGESKVYKSGEIKAFGYFSGEHYVSQIVKDSFSELLVKGEVSLYSNGENFILQKDTSLYELTNKQSVTRINGQLVKTEELEWKGILNFTLGSCVNVENLVFKKSDLVKAVEEFNTCNNNPSISYEVRQNPIVNFGLSLGISRSKTPSENFRNELGFGSFVSNATNQSESLYPSIGALISIKPYNYRRSSVLLIGFVLEKSFYSGTYLRKEISYLQTEQWEYSNFSFTIPVNMRHYISFQRPHVFLQYGGLIKSYNVSAEVEATRDFGTVRSTSIQEKIKNSFGISLGLGATESIGKLKLDLLILYERINQSGFKNGEHKFTLGTNIFLPSKRTN